MKLPPTLDQGLREILGQYSLFEHVPGQPDRNPGPLKTMRRIRLRVVEYCLFQRDWLDLYV